MTGQMGKRGHQLIIRESREEDGKGNGDDDEDGAAIK